MASGRIKGITIEIGGDTTKLDKALKGVDSQLAKTQQSLKDVDRLLKLDPGNVELLAQKEQYLGQQAEQAAERLKTVKEAAAGADAALARQHDFKAKYASLLSAHAEAGTSYEKLKAKDDDLKRQMERGEISAEQYDKHKAKLDEAKKAYFDLGKQVSEAKKEMGGPMIDQAQFDALQRELVSATEEAKRAEKAYLSFDESLAKVSATAGKVSNGAAGVANATKGISAAAGVAAGGLVSLAVNAGKTADDLNTLSKQSGFSTETLQQWQYASDLIDVSVEDIVAAARKMKKNMGSSSEETQAAFEKLGVSVKETAITLKNADVLFYEVVQGLSNIPDEAERNAIAMTLLGQSFDEVANTSAVNAASAVENLRESMTSTSSEVQSAFLSIGVSVNDVSANFMDAEKVFYQLVERLSLVENETERDVLAMQLFGKSADDLAGIIDDGGAALRELGQEAKDAGLILSQDALDNANKFNDGLDKLKATAQATFLEAGADLTESLLPAMEKIVEAVGSLLSWFASLDSGTLEILLGVLLAVAAIAPVASAISAIAGAVSTVSAGVGALTAALGAFNIVGNITALTLGKWVLIIGAVVAAVLLLVWAISQLTGKSKDIKMPEIPSIPGSDGSISVPTGSGYSLRTASAQDLPHLAQGTVTRANSPYLAVVGDNKNEPEVISPLSTIKQAVLEASAMAGGSSGGHTRVTVNFTGSMAQLVRMMQPEITVETNRRGPEFVQ